MGIIIIHCRYYKDQAVQWKIKSFWFFVAQVLLFKVPTTWRESELTLQCHYVIETAKLKLMF